MMPLVAAQFLLSLTFLVSGFAKLGHARGTQDAMASLRLPLRRLHPVVARVLPVAEIALALAPLVPVGPLRMIGASLALLLVLGYLVIIVRALGFDEEVTCSCFGRLGSPTVSRATAARNVVLTVLAVLALIGAAAGGAAEMAGGDPVRALLLAVVVAVSVLLTGLTVAGSAPTGSAAAGDARGPDEEDLDYERSPTPFGLLREEGGDLVTLGELTRERAALLLFVHPRCGSCQRTIDAVGGWRDRLGDLVQVRTLTRHEVDSLPGDVRTRAAGTLALDVERNLQGSLGIGATPAAVLVGADGQLAGGPVTGAEDVAGFVEEILEQLAEARQAGSLPV